MKQIALLVSVLCIMSLASASKPAIVTTATQVSVSVDNTTFPLVPGEELIKFDRENMSPWNMNATWLVEGYWRKSKTDVSSTEKEYPFPTIGKPWQGQEEFLLKLNLIELMTRQSDLFDTNGIIEDTQKAQSPSRITEENLSCVEYHDCACKVVWTGGLRWHYFQKYNVLPSRQFYRYVHARAAEFGIHTLDDTQKAMYSANMKIHGKQTAFGMLPWNDRLRKKRLLKALSSLIQPHMQYFDNYDDDDDLCPEIPLKDILPQAQNLAPELCGDKYGYWRDALLRSRKLTRKYPWIFQLLKQIRAERRNIAIDHYITKTNLASLYQDYK